MCTIGQEFKKTYVIPTSRMIGGLLMAFSLVDCAARCTGSGTLQNDRDEAGSLADEPLGGSSAPPPG